MGDDGAGFENLVAAYLLKHIHWQQDAKGKDVNLHYLRTKDGAEIDLGLSAKTNNGETLTHLLETKLSDTKPRRALTRFAGERPNAWAVQIVLHLRQVQGHGAVEVRYAAERLRAFDA